MSSVNLFLDSACRWKGNLEGELGNSGVDNIIKLKAVSE